MNNFVNGFVSSLAATFVGFVLIRWAWPNFKDKCLYSGIRVDGSWDITAEREGKQMKEGRLELKQVGRSITGTSVRSKTREGKKSERRFTYRGVIQGNQVTLLFEDAKGVGFDSGTYVFTVQNDAKTMLGMATFHGRKENRIISESRTLTKTIT